MIRMLNRLMLYIADEGKMILSVRLSRKSLLNDFFTVIPIYEQEGVDEFVRIFSHRYNIVPFCSMPINRNYSATNCFIAFSVKLQNKF